ncbi:DNA polymerase III subunit beta family protein [Streptomyces sp. NPDC055243]|uniref:DNA polymerase III subunit beta n=1 Tax=Streptomyces sp. NPDC055243 TaxID=3365720 RepID=UPI0037D3976D
MLATVPQPELAAAARWAARQLPAKPSQPVLLGSRLEATEGRLRISVWDGANAAHATLNADVETSGVVIPSGQMLANVVANLNKTDVTLAGDHDLTVTTPTAEFRIPGINVHDYPTLPQLPETLGKVDGNEFAVAYQRVHRAISPKAVGQFAGMAGIRLKVLAGMLKLSATDRFRIASAWLPWDGDFETEAMGVVPGKVMADNAKVFDGDLRIALPADGNGTVALICGENAVAGLLIDPTVFPHKVDTQIPNEFTGHILGSAADLVAAIHAAMAVSTGNLLWINTSGSKVTLRAGADASSKVTADAKYDGDHNEFEIAINAGYLLDGLAPIAGDALISLTTPARPALVADVCDDTYQYTVVPIRDPAKAAA